MLDANARPNLILFSISLPGMVTTGVWLTQYVLGYEPTWGLGIVLFFFLLLGAVAFRTNRALNQAEDARQNSINSDRTTVAERLAALDARPVAKPEVSTMVVGGRRVDRFKTGDPHQDLWREAVIDFTLHAWAAKTFSGPKLIARGVVKFNDQWTAITEVLVKSGVVVKRNGIGTEFINGWTFRRVVRAIQLGELTLVVPEDKPPPVLPVPLTMAPEEGSEAEGAGRSLEPAGAR